MDRGIWAIWYDVANADRLAYLDWFHRVHIPEKLARPGYVWAAHYAMDVDCGASGPPARPGVPPPPGPDRGTGFLALFGGDTVAAFLDPSPGQLKDRQDAETRRMIGMRRNAFGGLLAEAFRTDGPARALRGPGVTPGPWIAFELFSTVDAAAEDPVLAGIVQQRLPRVALHPGAIGARALLGATGWARFGLLQEFATQASLAAALASPMPAAPVIHANASPGTGRRIWPPPATSSTAT
jgi:hypothetical protein